MCALGRASNASSIAVALTLAISESGQPPPKTFEPHLRDLARTGESLRVVEQAATGLEVIA